MKPKMVATVEKFSSWMLLGYQDFSVFQDREYTHLDQS